MTNSKIDLRESFLLLPEDVRDWLTSEQATYLVIDINKRLDLFGEDLKTIPNLITRLAVKDLDPKNLAVALKKELDVDFEQAKALAREIEEKILRPVAIPLKQANGVDVRDIYLGKQELAPEEELGIPLIAPEVASPKTRVVSDVRREPAPAPPPPPPPVPSTPPAAPAEPSKEKTGDAPFILHEERAPVAPVAKEEGGPSFSFKSADTIRRPSPPPPPPVAKVERPDSGAIRVVHYSNLRTIVKLEDNRRKATEV